MEGGGDSVYGIGSGGGGGGFSSVPPNDIAMDTPTPSTSPNSAGVDSMQYSVPPTMVTPEEPHIEIKLFVGKVPKDATEEQVRAVFAPFGNVLEVAIIRDKSTGVHKGSAFVRMASLTQADVACNSLDKKKSPLGELQVSYAVGEQERLGLPLDMVHSTTQAKLFVGSLPRTVTEDLLMQTFQPYAKVGTIDEVYVMRDDQGNPKGCAFVKVSNKAEALHAKNALHGQTPNMPGVQRGMEVRFAEKKGAARAESRPTDIPRSAGLFKEFFTADGKPYYYNVLTRQTQWERPGDFDRPDTTGPPGANVFVYGVPDDWTSADLVAHFYSFGNIVSAMVARDKPTGRPRQYGFVSFDNPAAAVKAVMNVNRSIAGGRFLQVSIKENERRYVSHLVQQQPQQGQNPPLQQQQPPPAVPGVGGYNDLGSAWALQMASQVPRTSPAVPTADPNNMGGVAGITPPGGHAQPPHPQPPLQPHDLRQGGGGPAPPQSQIPPHSQQMYPPAFGYRQQPGQNPPPY